MKTVWKVLSYVIVAVLASVATLSIAPVNVSIGNTEYNKLDQLGDLIEERFIGETDRTAMEDAAAAAMVDSIGDRWSYYMSTETYQAHLQQVNNSYVGIGVTIQVSEEVEGFEIIQINTGGPAAEAGRQIGDRIVAVAGTDVRGMTTSETALLVKGEEGTFVDITVVRGDSELTLSVERRQVLVEVTSYQMLEDNIGLITITNFDTRCADETISAIDTLLEQGAKSLIFDVRNNPGGYKDELVKVLDHLLPEGPLFRSEDYKGVVQVDESDAACVEVPMAVLVNGNSYSAAEFFAAALREYDAAIVVGNPTTGKGYFQTTIRLYDGSAVNLSIGKYTTPNGVSLAEAGGLVPDIQVEVDEETDLSIYAGILEPSADPQIQAAVEALKSE